MSGDTTGYELRPATYPDPASLRQGDRLIFPGHGLHTLGQTGVAELDAWLRRVNALHVVHISYKPDTNEHVVEIGESVDVTAAGETEAQRSSTVTPGDIVKVPQTKWDKAHSVMLGEFKFEPPEQLEMPLKDYNATDNNHRLTGDVEVRFEQTYTLPKFDIDKVPMTSEMRAAIDKMKVQLEEQLEEQLSMALGGPPSPDDDVSTTGVVRLPRS